MDALSPKFKARRSSKVSVPKLASAERLSKSRIDAKIEVDRSISHLDQIIEDLKGPEMDDATASASRIEPPVENGAGEPRANQAMTFDDTDPVEPAASIPQDEPHFRQEWAEVSEPRPSVPPKQEALAETSRKIVSIEGDSDPIKVSNPRQDSAAGSGNGGGRRFGGGDGGARVHKNLGPQDFSKSLKAGIRAVRRNLSVVMLFTFASNILVLAIPIYLFQISDRVFVSRSVDTLVMLTIVIIGAVVLQAVIDALRRFILMRTAVEVAAQLGTPILTAAARAALHSNGREYQTLGDLQQLRGFLVSGTLLSFLDAPFVPIFIVAIYLVHPHLGLIVIGSALLLLVIALINQKATSRPFGDANTHQSKANLHLESMSRNSQIINAMAMIPEAVKIWGRDTATSLSAQIIAQDRNIAAAAVSKMVRLLTQVALLGWGAYLSLHGHITGGMVIAGSIIAGRALAPIEGAIEGWNQYVLSRGAYDRIKMLLQSSVQNYERLNLPNPEGRLDVERLLYVPQGTKRVVLNGISFTLMPGESLAIIGNSGAGKTTVGKMLVGSIMPTSGNVRLDLMDLRNWDQRQFGENIGYLPQDIQLFPGTIKDNIGRMRENALDADIYSAAMLADVHEMIASLPQGYETVVAADGAPLSGGQKQRIALARAFYGNPKFVVLDEPNSNLDGAGDEALARALTHAKQQKITVVAITQKSSLLKCIDKIILMANGTIALSGHRNDVLKTLAGQRGQPGALQAQLS
jgi:ATP-binding cassette, subfamily C, bacterial